MFLNNVLYPPAYVFIELFLFYFRVKYLDLIEFLSCSCHNLFCFGIPREDLMKTILFEHKYINILDGFYKCRANVLLHT